MYWDILLLQEEKIY